MSRHMSSISFVLRNTLLFRSIKKRPIRISQSRSNPSSPAIIKPPSLQKRDAGNGIGKYFLLVIPIGTCGLGIWQVYRLQWKLNLIDELKNKTSHPAVPLPDNLNQLDDMEYQKVKLIGEFDHSQEMFLGPRPLVVQGQADSSGGLISTGHQSGFNVVTPFLLSDKKLKILVNRGWIPRKHQDQSHRTLGQVTGPVEITAIVRKREKRQPFMQKNVTTSNVFNFRDIAMAEVTGSAPIFVDAVETVEGGPIGSQTRVTLRNEHLSYIITWFSLSLATSYMWYKKFKKPAYHL